MTWSGLLLQEEEKEEDHLGRYLQLKSCLVLPTSFASCLAQRLCIPRDVCGFDV